MNESTPPYKVVGFFARTHGFNAIEEIIKSEKYDLIFVATHRRLPTADDPERSERPDFKDFVDICEQNNIPYMSVDSKDQKVELELKLSTLSFDILASLSWRYHIPNSIRHMPRLGGVNLHRGRLPDYPFAGPIKQALEHGDKEITVSGHLLEEVIDTGKVISTYRHPVTCDPNLPIDEQRVILKKELTPHMGPLMISTMDALILDPQWT